MPRAISSASSGLRVQHLKRRAAVLAAPGVKVGPARSEKVRCHEALEVSFERSAAVEEVEARNKPKRVGQFENAVPRALVPAPESVPRQQQRPMTISRYQSHCRITKVRPEI